jgi:hypothetical protein
MTPEQRAAVRPLIDHMGRLVAKAELLNIRISKAPSRAERDLLRNELADTGNEVVRLAAAYRQLRGHGAVTSSPARLHSVSDVALEDQDLDTRRGRR